MSTNRVDEETASRRTVLRGALALGCGMLVPTVLAGCDSGKGGSSGGNSPAPATSTEAPSTPAAPEKVSQESVQYQYQPNGEQSCSGCLHYIAESSTCMLVEGRINPDGWCTLWARKA